MDGDIFRIVIYRVYTIVVLLFFIIWAPWWIFFPLILCAFFFFKHFYEGLVLLFFADLLYGLPPLAGVGVWNVYLYSLFFFITGAVVLFLVEMVRPRLRFEI